MATTKQKRTHIFFVYDDSDKASVEVVTPLKNKFKKDHYRVFRDSVLHDARHVNECIAKGVENAAVIVVVASNGLQNSRSASKILNYADQRRALIVEVQYQTDFHATGWLGVILAAVKRSSSNYEEVLTTLKSAGVNLDLMKREEKEEEEAAQATASSSDSEVLFYGGSASNSVTGYYEQYDKKYPMTYEFFGLQNGYVMGQGDDAVGSFTIAGEYASSGNGEAHFTKQYVGKHKVEYAGTIKCENRKCTIAGKWHIGNLSDGFEIALTLPDAGQLSAMKAFLTVTKALIASKVLIVYSPSQRALAEKIAEKFNNTKMEVVLPDDDINAMIGAVADAKVVVPVINADFQQSDASRKVMLCVDNLRIPIVPVKSQDDYAFGDWLGAICAGMLYTQITEKHNDNEFEQNFSQLVSQLDACKVDSTDQGAQDVVFEGGEVKGYYKQYDEEHPMKFDFLTMKNGRIAGQGDDGIGGFAIAGNYTTEEDSSLKFHFKKQYTGKHSVEYDGTGTKSGDLVVLEGQWSIGEDCTGEFKLTLVKSEKIQKGNAQPHVMLSYQWNSQKLVVEVANFLKKHGVHVWLDVQGDMKGNINVAMAQGVESAGIVTTFITTPYTASPNCRKEFAYTLQLKKSMIPVLLDDGYQSNPFFKSAVENKEPMMASKMAQEEICDSLLKLIQSKASSVVTVETKSNVATVFEGGAVQGQYYYEGSATDMEFAFFRLVNGRVSGHGNDEVGEFTMSGTYNENGEVQFTKQYIGQHEVEYKGSLKSEGPGKFEIEGNWNIGEMTDKFVLCSACSA